MHLHMLVFVLTVKPEYEQKILKVLQTYQEIKNENLLLTVEFQTLSDYLQLLKACSFALQPAGNQAVLYLAAAVSDFYIPKDLMVICMQIRLKLEYQ